MKRIVKIFLVITLVFAISLSDNQVYASKNKTLGDLENELVKLRQKYQANVSEKKQTQGQIENNKKAVVNSFSEKTQNEQNVEVAKKKVEESEKKVQEVTEQSNDLLRFFQMANGENVYLSYIADSNSITDFVIRAAVTEQLSTYNNEKLAELENLIQENNQRQLDLAARNKELDNAVVRYQNNIDNLGIHLNEISDISIDLEGEIQTLQKEISYYKGLGCKSNQLLSVCAATMGDTRLVRPTQKGRVSSPYGPRGGGFHYGIDIAGNAEGTAIYSPANGTVIAVPRRIPYPGCGGRTLYIYHNINGQGYTSVYAHLLSVNVKVGDKVTPNTVVGTVGGGPKAGPDCSTGPHLHYSIARGRQSTYSSAAKNFITPFPFTNRSGWAFSTRF